jgi:ribosomal protein S18 acetylase RimI-like enzyme
VIEYIRFARKHLAEVAKICRDESWPSFSTDLEITWRALTAPGVTAVVARAASKVVGFAYLQSDGVVQAHRSLIALRSAYRRKGIARRLVETAFARSGAKRLDLLSTAGAGDFYRSFEHRAHPGFRSYPEARVEASRIGRRKRSARGSVAGR